MNKYNLLLFALVSLLLFPSPSKPTKTSNPVEFDFPTFEEMPKTHLPCHRMKRNPLPKFNTISTSSPSCLQMYVYIEKYSDSFNIPKKYAYGLAYSETRYEGPFHWEYKHDIVSEGGALGPMQILLSTARKLNGDMVTPFHLTNNIDYNIMTSMKLLRKLKNMYQKWELALGAYNTGKPLVNKYSTQILKYDIKWNKNIINEK